MASSLSSSSLSSRKRSMDAFADAVSQHNHRLATWSDKRAKGAEHKVPAGTAPSPAALASRTAVVEASDEAASQVHRFECDEDDHAETPLLAYEHVAPFLEQLALCLKKVLGGSERAFCSRAQQAPGTAERGPGHL
jgi:hypothetical protein